MLHFSKRASVLLSRSLAGSAAIVRTTPVAHAQNVFREDIVGTCTGKGKDVTILRSNGTYTFNTGDRLTTNLSPSGTWSLRDNQTTLRLRATRRVVREGRCRRTLRINKIFDLAITSGVPISRVPNIITLDGEVFTRPVRY